MSEYTARVVWRNDVDASAYLKSKYTRVHTWEFDSGQTLRASASPHNVPMPYSVEDAVDPEEAYVAAISSCHMLTFLYLAAKRGFVVESYDDSARGTMEKNAQGRMAITSVRLSPAISFGGDKGPSADELAALHHASHEECFIANSIKTEVVVTRAG